jgi:hypothetical protein
MVSTIAVVAVLVATVLASLASLAIWRNTRRPLTVGDIKDISVSRQWLQQHQGDDRS